MDYNYYETYNSELLDPSYFMPTMLISLAITVLTIIGLWKIFEKAGIAGWKAIIPIYSTYLVFKIALGNGWLFLLLLVPLANVIVLILAYAKLATAFGKGAGYALGLIFLNPIFTMILGFGSAQYQGTK